MPEFLLDNIFVVFEGKVFQQIVGIPTGSNCAPLIADIFSVLIRSGIHTVFALNWKEKVSHLSATSHTDTSMTYCGINNPDFENYLGQMYPAELEIKHTAGSNTTVHIWIYFC